MSEQAEKKTYLSDFLWYHLPVILYAGVIIALSSIPNLKTPQIQIVALDKVAHFFEYAIFAFLTFRSVTHITDSITITKSLLISALFLSLFALLDEYYQHCIPGRHLDLWDYITDVGGALFVLAILGLRQHRSKTKQGSNS